MTSTDGVPGLVKATVRQSYDSTADDYARRRRMQSGNLGVLDRLVLDEVGVEKPRAILDLGCGAGHGTKRLLDLFGASALVVGLDLSESLVRLSKEMEPTASAAVADAELLPIPRGVFDLVVSNSVLHWLNAPRLGQTPEAALDELHRVLRPGGLVAMSIAGVGTARKFQRSFAEVIHDYRRRGLVDEAVHRPDPIGSLSLHEAVELFERAHMRVRRAWLAYEPVEYDHPADYAADVAAYGFGPYTASVPAAERAGFFDAVTARFASDQGSGRYAHDQYMIYISAERMDS